MDPLEAVLFSIGINKSGVYEVEGERMLASFIMIPGQDLAEVSGEVHGLPFTGFMSRAEYSFLVLTPFPELVHGESNGNMLVAFQRLHSFAGECKTIV